MTMNLFIKPLSVTKWLSLCDSIPLNVNKGYRISNNNSWQFVKQ